MPDLWTHYYFAKEVEGKLNLKHFNEYYLGTQGPDFLYYYNFLGLKNKTKDFKLGTLMHKDKTKELLDFVYDELDNANDLLRDYLYGFLAHYALDSTAHSFVYYYAKDDVEHKKLEANIDVKMHYDLNRYSIRKQKSTNIVNVGKNLPKEIIDFYKKAALELYGVKINDEINDSYKDFINFLTLTRANNIFKIALLKTISFFYTREVYHFVYPKEVNTEILTNDMYREFMDLYKKAIKKYEILVTTRKLTNIRNFDGDLVE